MLNLETYEKKYKNGYGIQFPEGHIIRIYNNIIKGYFNKGNKGLKLLDFGCGNGIHSKFFSDKGFKPYGVDISEDAIQLAKMNNSRYEHNFMVIKDNDINCFNEKFDFILANQSLYYLNNMDLNKVIKQFDDLLEDNGIVVFTMMSQNNYYYNCIEERLDNGLSKVVLTGRLNEMSYINFTKDFEELKKKFLLFRPIFCGIYDMTMIEGSSEHLYFIGKKVN